MVQKRRGAQMIANKIWKTVPCALQADMGTLLVRRHPRVVRTCVLWVDSVCQREIQILQVHARQSG